MGAARGGGTGTRVEGARKVFTGTEPHGNFGGRMGGRGRALAGMARRRAVAATPPLPPPKLTPKHGLMLRTGSSGNVVVINAPSRIMRQLGGGYGNVPGYGISLSGRETLTGSTLSTFLPNYQSFTHELNVVNLNSTQQERNAAKNILQQKQNFLNEGLEEELDKVKSGLYQDIHAVLLPQNSRGQRGITKNLLTLPNESFLERTDDFGTGTYLRDEMISVLNNAEFFSGISLDVDAKNKTFTLNYTDTNNQKIALVNGKIDANHMVHFAINDKVPPELRDLAIQHNIFMIASHVQQTRSNKINITFGDNADENLRMLQFAIGVHNLRVVPSGVIEAYIKNTLAANDPLKSEFEFWAKHSETFKEKVNDNGTKIIDNNHRPRDRNNKLLDDVDVAAMLLRRVSDDAFGAQPTPAPTPPAAPPLRPD